MTNFGTHLNVELQQRGVEYAQLFTKHIGLRPAIMERVPPMEHKSSHHQDSNGLTNGGSAGGLMSNGDDDMLMDDLNSFTSTNHSAPAPKDSVIRSIDFLLDRFHFLLIVILCRHLCSIYWVDWTISMAV